MKGRIVTSLFVLGSVLIPGIAGGALTSPVNTDRVQPISSRGISVGVTDSINSQTTYIDSVNPGISSVAAGEALNGYEYWGAGVGNLNGSTVQSGAQVVFNTQSTGIDMTGWNFQYFYPNSEGGFGITQSPCPPPSAHSETCPATGATLPAGADISTAGFPGLPSTFSPGFDSSFNVGPVDSNGNALVTTSVALNNPRFATSTTNQITVSTFTDNAEQSSTPSFTSNGAPVPQCPQPIGTACAAPVQWATYQYSPTPGGSPTACNSVQMQLDQIPFSGASTPYQFTFQEIEKGTGGCPIGSPGIQVAVVNEDPTQTVPCTPGTDCSATVSLPGFGVVTASVDAGQGVTGFDDLHGMQYWVVYPASNASPPHGAASTVTGSSTTPGGSATATDGGTSVAAENGTGVVLVSQFNSNPVSSPPLGSNGNYFDVQLAHGSTFTGVSVMDCNSKNNVGTSVDTLEWWNGTGWVPVTDANGNRVDYAGVPPCASVTLNSMTSPSIGQLTGTVFAVAAKVAVVAAKPAPVTVRFANAKSSLSGTAKLALSTLARKLMPNAEVTIVGYAKDNARLATTRAKAVAVFLSTKVMLHTTLKTVTRTAASQVTVTTIRQ
jgi:outer membrane protein OmpA-like peptidoglycan-associated protein